jgi:hypothetical protein
MELEKESFRRKKKRFRAIFGKLVVKYTRGKIISQKESFKFIQRYSVLCTDETSVAIVVHGGVMIKNIKSEFLTRELLNDLFSKPKIVHLHFTGTHYWISFGKNREFFRRIRQR